MANRSTLRRYTAYAFETLQSEGLRAVGGRALDKLAKETHKIARKIDGTSSKKTKKFNSIVNRQDVLLADVNRKMPSLPTKPPAKVINWVISPPRNGGGHMNMFRFIERLDAEGYTNNIYLYTTHDHISPTEAKDNVAQYAKLQRANFYRYKRGTPMAEAVAVFATGWETAYPVLNEVTYAKKFYFIQDFEPLFYPVGTEYVLAEATYKFGFHGITAGRWLAMKLKDEFGMACDSYDFGADKTFYKNENTQKRKEVFFYARPVTERRAFDLGIMALELFHEKHPEYTINLAGWDVSNYVINFPYVNHKTLQLEELGELYNKCVTGLVLSLTNMSLLPLELLSCGVIPVVNDGENNRLVSNNPFIAYSGVTPVELADKLSEVVERENQVEYASEAANSVEDLGWDKAKDIFMDVMQREIHG